MAPVHASAARALLVVLCALSLLTSSAVTAAASDDPRFGEQWNLSQIGAANAWSTSRGQGVTIGVVDGGVDASHPDLAGKIDALADCVGGRCREGSAPDPDGHGTAVSGIAAAASGNGQGIAGVAPDARLIVAKALGDDGGGEALDISNAIRWVVDRGARVVNLSLGEEDLVIVSRVGTSIRSAVEYAWTRGAIPVLASGNSFDGSSEESANYGNLDAVVVGATDRDGRVSSYSTSLGNAKWGLVAPGGNGDGPRSDILAPLPNRAYGWLAGTSMAAPHVSGTLALLLAQGLHPAAAVNRLLGTLDRSQSCGTGCQGRLRADRAVQLAPPVTPPSTPPQAVVTTPTGEGADGRSPAVPALALVLAVGVGVASLVVSRRGRRPTGDRLPSVDRGASLIGRRAA